MNTLESELQVLEEKSGTLTRRWEMEKESLQDSQGLAEQLDVARIEAERAQRAGDLARAGELFYGVIPDLEAKLSKCAGDPEAERMIIEEVRDQDIGAVVSRWTGIPVDSMLQGEREKLLSMEDSLRGQVIGQDEAIASISNAVRRARAGLQDPNRPIGSFLFLGPTGVGKTELTKALSGFLFNDEQAMVRIDMSEFMEKHSVSRLIGAPPGYIGYDESGMLTEAVRRRPYQVVLFDEVEKAHPDVFNVLLQVLDDGRLTDGHGRTVDFKNILLIMTSNLGAEILATQAAGEDSDAVRDGVMEVVKDSFRPEFLNRIDEVLLFNRLSRQHMDGIVEIQLRHLRCMLEGRKITLDIDEAAKNWMADKGFDPAYGARPLKRVIQQELQNALATMLLAGRIADGDKVLVSALEGQLVINGEVAGAG